MNLYFTLGAQAKQEYMIWAIREPCNPLLTVHMDDEFVIDIFVDIESSKLTVITLPVNHSVFGHTTPCKDIMMCIMRNTANPANFT